MKKYLSNSVLVMVSIVAILTVFILYGCPKKPGDLVFGTEEERAIEKAEKAKKAPPAPMPAKPVTEGAMISPMPTSHNVVKGESLWVISEYKDVYNNPLQWPLIYKANKNQIKDPDLVFPGQNLTISRDNPYKEKEDAVKFAKTRGPWSLWDSKVLKYSEMRGFSEE
ncbi:MAG TPA: peptidoglycan-binding protein [Nitrospinota bacterium]|nr:peptidoglycan-binding protein [Nitrospinota bacterium]